MKPFALVAVACGGGIVGSVLFPLGVFAYEGAPRVTTKNPTFLTEKSVQLEGAVMPNEMPDTYVWFEWAISGRTETVYATPRRLVRGGSTFIPINTRLEGLAPGVQYAYRVVAENARGKDTGNFVYFTTKPLSATAVEPPIFVETRSAGPVDETHATIKGYVSPHGSRSGRWWFEWGDTLDLLHATPRRTAPWQSGEVSEALRNLIPGTAYYYRLVSESESGKIVGATRVFVTRGVAPVVASETPREQSLPTPGTGDGIPRNTTTMGSASGAHGVSSNAFGLPGVGNNTILPGDIFGLWKRSAGSPTSSDDQNMSSNAASVGGLGDIWDRLFGDAPVAVAVEKLTPEKFAPHRTVEYLVAYRYNATTPATNALLKITLPDELIYIGDNTNNELLFAADGGGERTYLLPIGALEKGDTREFSLVAMATANATAFPDARVRLEYTDASGAHVVAARGGTIDVRDHSALAAGGAGLLPNSLIGWIVYVLVVVGTVVGIRKAKAYYDKRKEEAQKAEEVAYDPELLRRLVPQKPDQSQSVMNNL